MKWVLRILALLLFVGVSVSPVMAANFDDISITVTPGVGILLPPTGLTLTDLGFVTVTANWTPSVSANASYTMLRGLRTGYPATPAEGELIYYGADSSDNIVGTHLDTSEYFVSGWAFAADNVTHSPDYMTASIGGEDMVELASGMSMLVLAMLALGLTIAMFATKSMMLGFPAAIMWAILGAYAYQKSTTAWGDWQYYLYFASAFGMTVFCVMAMYALRTKKGEKAEGDTLIDETTELGEPYIDEGGNGDREDKPSRLVRGVRKRAEERRVKGLNPRLKVRVR